MGGNEGEEDGGDRVKRAPPSRKTDYLSYHPTGHPASMATSPSTPLVSQCNSVFFGKKAPIWG